MRFCIIFLALAVLTISCGRIPEPVGYPYSEQKKMQAAYHWDVLAADIANQINNELILNDYLDIPVFVRETCGNENQPCKSSETTVFEESFRDLLITNLVALGVPTSPNGGNDSLVINYKAQTVYNLRNRWRTVKPGLLTALTAGIVVLRNAPSELIALVIAGTIDFANASLVTTSNFEVIITTSVIADNTYLFRNSNIYYINDHDSWHYQMGSNPAEINLTSSAAPAAEVKSDRKPMAVQPQPIIPLIYRPESTGI